MGHWGEKGVVSSLSDDCWKGTFSVLHKAVGKHHVHSNNSSTIQGTEKIRMSKRLGFNDSTTLLIYVDLEADKRSDYIEDEDDTIEIL